MLNRHHHRDTETKPGRKPVQIAVAYARSDQSEDGLVGRLFALCDDGTTWLRCWPI
jgi:hypothetical protein